MILLELSLFVNMYPSMDKIPFLKIVYSEASDNIEKSLQGSGEKPENALTEKEEE